MKKGIMIISMMSLVVLFQCDKNNITQSIDINYGENMFGSIEVSDTDIELLMSDNLAKGDNVNLMSYEVRLKYFAQGIAKLLNDPEIGAYLKDEIGKQFDGDYDVLWETLAGKEFAQKGKFKNILRKLYKSNIDMVDQFNNVPLLQVSAPVHFDKWNIDEPLLVAYDPLTIDDDECEQIFAFDMEGKEYYLNTKNDPAFPVIVVGINERKSYIYNNNQIAKTSSVQTTKYLKIIDFRLMDDHEPWYKGNAEIYVKTREGGVLGAYTFTNFVNVNLERLYMDADYTWLPKTVFTKSNYSDSITIELNIWEDDTSADDLVEGSYVDGDPEIPLNYKWFYGASNDADISCRSYY